MTIPILMYHQIDTPPKRGTSLRGLIVSPGAFKRHMALLRLLGYQGLSMRDLEPYLRGEKTGRVVGITFDDGYQNNLTNALPVLQKNQFTATCYAVSGMLGGTNIWDQGKVACKPLMTHEQWRAWHGAGMEIGSHTRTHADLCTLSDEAARQEIFQSKHELEAAFGCEIRHFCYPYGRFDARHKAWVQEAGYRTATTTRRGRTQHHDDPYCLRRVLVLRANTVVHLAAKLLTGYEDRRG